MTEAGAARPDGEERLRVLLTMASLHGAGGERVAVHLASGLDPARFDVRLGLLRRAGPYLAAVDPRQVEVAPDGDWLTYEQHNSGNFRPARLVTNVTRAPQAVAALVRRTRPHVVMSFFKGVSLATWAALPFVGRPRPRWIAREGNNVAAVIDDELASPLARAGLHALTARCYRDADAVLANSRDMSDAMVRTLGVNRDRIRWIPNPLDLEALAAQATEPLPLAPDTPFIVTAGRLFPQKGHDLLLRAFAASRVADGAVLVILGEGPERARLDTLAAELGVAERVRFEGFTPNPWAWFARARLFVLASRWEGFPNALQEAMACGAPCLATDCDFGPREIIRTGDDGLLVAPEDVGALRAGLDTLLGDPALAARMGAAARASAQRFALPATVAAYGALFEAVAARG